MPDDLMLLRSTPVSALRDWLLKNTENLRLMTEYDITLQARLALPEIAAMDNVDIACEIHQWAKGHSFMILDLPKAPDTPSFLVPGGPGAAPVRAGDSEMLNRLESQMKSVQSVLSGFQWTGDGASAGISVSGATASLGKGDEKLTAAVGWDRTVELKTGVAGMNFSAKIDPINKNWSMTLTVGDQAPNLADVAGIFQQGESALRGVLANAGKVDLSNVSKSAQQFAPYVGPIKSAVDAASKIAKQRSPYISYGISLKGGSQTAPAAGGFTATALLTINF